MSKPLFTSDLHFNHANIVRYSNRPWTTDNQTRTIIDRWNSRVGDFDDVYHLGDFAFIYPKKIGMLFEIIEELNGSIHFIRGNHCDPKVWQLVEDKNYAHVEWIKDYHEMKVGHQPIVMCHYPFETWNRAHHGSWHLHGHTHGSLPSRGKRLDVGIDNHAERTIFTFDEVEAYMAKQNFEVIDHHTGERD